MSVTLETDVACGWYQDPAGTGMLRWWDGIQWTDQLERPRPEVQPATPKIPLFTTVPKRRF
jgi:Protein of unknown function (DUF2510)